MANGEPGTFQELRGYGLLLRRLGPEDADDVMEISYYDGVAATTAGEAAAMLARIEADQRRGEAIHWGICLDDGQSVLGTIGFYRGFAGGTGEVGYVLKERYRGKGYATNALRLVSDFGLSVLGLREVVAFTEQDNAPSVAVLGRAGFVPVPWPGPQLKFSLRRTE